MNDRPRLLFTMGDVAGIGPEIIARSWPELNRVCRPIVVGDVDWLGKALKLVGSSGRPFPVAHPGEREPTLERVPCLPGSREDVSGVVIGRVSAAGGKAAYDYLCTAIDHTLSGAAAGIVTAPLHKEGLRAAGLPYPGHTEILAERTGTRNFAMLLYSQGIAVAHVTLHVALRDVFALLSTTAVLEKIHLLDAMMVRLLGRRPRIGVAALNPHASDGGLFGDEEERLIRPAVVAAAAEGITASGPWPCDTLFVRARRGEFDGVVAMYHDQGHVALKLLGPQRAVNVCAGLPIVRTSVAHGTAYDIAGQGIADAEGMVEAARVAAVLATSRGTPREPVTPAVC